MRGVGQGLPSIPLDPMPSSGYRLSSAAAGSARDLAPTTPDPEEAYEPPLEAEDQWTSEGLVSRQPMINRVSPLVTPQLSSAPTEIGDEAVGPAPAGVETPPPSLAGRAGVLRHSDMIEEAATVACIPREPDFADMLGVPDLSLFSPPAPIPQVKPEPVEVVEIPDSPPSQCTTGRHAHRLSTGL